MSKLVKIAIECPKCSHQYTGDFFRTIWGEHESNRSMVMEDRINIATCPHCGHKFHLPLAMMYVDVVKGFAVWWEPNHDPGIDSDTAGYEKMFGVNSYYAKAPRIADWEEFKQVINDYYSGKIKASPIEKMDINALKDSLKASMGSNTKTTSKSGCAGVLVLLIAVIIGVLSI